MSDYIYINGELYHHGIQGQKWGVRRGPPYPLDGSKTYTAKKKNKRNGLSDKQKKILLYGALAIGAGVAIYGGVKMSQLHGDDLLKGAASVSNGLRTLTKLESSEEALSKINPGRISYHSKNGYKNLEIIHGSSANCMLCTTAYDLRMRGYDVHAGLSMRGYLPETLFPKIYSNYTDTTKIEPTKVVTEFKNIFGGITKITNADINSYATVENIVDTIRQQGSGETRGNLIVWWRGNNGGHSMIWEKLKDGTVRFLDGQTNEIYDNKSFHKIIDNINPTKSIEILRTDNLELDYDGIKKYLNTDTEALTYAKHGAEVAARLMVNTNEGRALTVAGLVGAGIAYKQKNKKDYIDYYREEHPQTKLSDKEILDMFYM